MEMAIEMITEEITGPGAWLGPDLQNDDRLIIRLDAGDIAEIDAALAAVKQAGLSVPFPASAFPLPNVTAKIDDIVERVSHGTGFALVRGLPRERYSVEECELIYWGIGAHIGTPVSQNGRGHVLGDDVHVLSPNPLLR